ncbi:MAG: cell division protein FtsL [bacterium]
MVKIKKRQDLKAKNRRVFWGVILIMCFFSMLSFFTWQRLQITELNRKLEKADRILGKLKGYNQELRLERASLTSSSRIKTLAMARLEMKDPEPGQVIVLP